MSPKLVSNIGGAFIYSENPLMLAEWYRKYLGIEFEAAPDLSAYYSSFYYLEESGGRKAYTAWSIIRSNNRPQHVRDKLFMINYRVFNADQTVAHLRDLGLMVKGVETYPEGKFAWCCDPEGNDIELWEDTTQIPNTTLK
ncbi:MAG TPA: VOC family protein [Bacteroidia bacterium]|jgi:predicted enzyme related to lactoylglutathione lyase|nr:VOC family protein [Bacteroidia bacterium]